MPKKKIVALGGDGVGPEVMEVTCHILEKAGYALEISKPLCGNEALKTRGNAFPEEARKLCEESDAVLFGAAEGPSVAILVHLRWVMDNYINLRPVKYYPGANSPLRNPEGIDFHIIRENSEGMYPGREGDIPWLAQKISDYRDPFGRTLDYYGEGQICLALDHPKRDGAHCQICRRTGLAEEIGGLRREKSPASPNLTCCGNPAVFSRRS